MKIRFIHWDLSAIMGLVVCILIFDQSRINADESVRGTGEESPTFKIYDNMKCGISEFQRGILSTVNLRPFTENQKKSLYSAKPVHFISLVEYTGKTRRIPEEKIETFLTLVSVRSKNIESFFKQYMSEMLFLENNQEYWIPVQEQNIKDFAKYGVKPGDNILLRNIYFGFEAFKNGSFEFCFFMQAFAEYKDWSFQSATTEDAVFVLYKGEIHMIPASDITDADYQNSKSFAEWLKNHRTRITRLFEDKKFTGIIANSKNVWIIVDNRGTLLYDFSVTNGVVHLRGKKWLSRVIKNL